MQRFPRLRAFLAPCLAVLGAFLVLCASLPGCASKSDPPRNGVDDVKKACEIRATWTMPTTARCLNCMFSAPAPKCDCEAFKDFGALCADQGSARKADPQCTIALDDCVTACVRTDCACIDACYVAAPSCKAHDAARDGCVADVCTQFCN